MSVVDSSFADNSNSIETLGTESKCDPEKVIHADEVLTPEQSHESEISGKNVSVVDSSFGHDRKSIETVGNESNGDKVNISESKVVTQENNEKEEVLPRDFDSCDDDDDNVPLSKLKMSRSVSHKNTGCFTDIDADNGESKCDGANDSCTIEGIIKRLTDNEEKDNESDHHMSMEEYRLTYAQDYLKGAVYEDATIIKETRHEVDSQIYSLSDTTVTTVTSESLNVSSDSEPEIVIHRKKSSKKIKKKRLIMKKRII